MGNADKAAATFKEGLEEAKRKDLYKQICPAHVITAAEILNEML